MWPKLMALGEYRRITYTGDRKPTLRTLKRLIDQSDLPGEKQGAHYYVGVGPDHRAMTPPGHTDTLADQILQSWLEETPHAKLTKSERIP